MNLPVMMTTLPAARGVVDSGATLMMGARLELPERWLAVASRRRLAWSDIVMED